MANLRSNTKLANGVYHDIYQHRFYGGNNYFHYKTNIPIGSYIMAMIEAVGYAYGSNNSIRSSWCFYAYTSSIINVGVQNVYSGMSATGVYLSSDNYVVIVANVASYYSGWMFNGYTLNPAGYNHPIQFTAVVQTDVSGNYY